MTKVKEIIVKKIPGTGFEATPDNPNHFSVGAIPIRTNESGEIEVLVHYFEQTPPYALTSPEPRSFKKIYKLMTETPEILKNGSGKEVAETREETISRGMKEEFGMNGSVDNKFYWRERASRMWYFRGYDVVRKVNKTTDYYLVRNVKEIGGRDMNSLEGMSELKWIPIVELIEAMRDQGKRYPDIPDGDESIPLINALLYLEIDNIEARFWANVLNGMKRK